MVILKNAGIILLFLVLISAISVYFPQGIIFFVPLSFFKGYLIKEARAGIRAVLLFLNTFLFLTAFVLLFYVIQPEPLTQGVDDLAAAYFIFIFFYIFVDVIIFWIGMGVKNRRLKEKK